MTRKRLYRCHACGWRGWMKVSRATEDDQFDEESNERLDLTDEEDRLAAPDGQEAAVEPDTDNGVR